MVKQGIPEVQKTLKIIKEEKGIIKQKTVSHYAKPDLTSYGESRGRIGEFFACE